MRMPMCATHLHVKCTQRPTQPGICDGAFPAPIWVPLTPNVGLDNATVSRTTSTASGSTQVAIAAGVGAAVAEPQLLSSQRTYRYGNL